MSKAQPPSSILPDSCFQPRRFATSSLLTRAICGVAACDDLHMEVARDRSITPPLVAIYLYWGNMTSTYFLLNHR